MLDSSIWLLASDEYYVDVRLILSYRSLSARWWRKCLGVRTVWSITVFYYLSQTEYNGRTLTVCWPDQQISTSGGSLSPPAPAKISLSTFTRLDIFMDGRLGGEQYDSHDNTNQLRDAILSVMLWPMGHTMFGLQSPLSGLEKNCVERETSNPVSPWSEWALVCYEQLFLQRADLHSPLVLCSLIRW